MFPNMKFYRKTPYVNKDENESEYNHVLPAVRPFEKFSRREKKKCFHKHNTDRSVGDCEAYSFYMKNFGIINNFKDVFRTE